MISVARHWWSISNKTKILFSVIDKKTQSTFILDNMAVPTIWMMKLMKKMFLCLKHEADATTAVEWNEGMNI